LNQESPTVELLSAIAQIGWPKRSRFWDHLYARKRLLELEEFHHDCLFGGSDRLSEVGGVLMDDLVIMFQIYCAVFHRNVRPTSSWQIDPAFVAKRVAHVWLNTPEGLHTVDRIFRGSGLEGYDLDVDVGSYKVSEVVCYAAIDQGFDVVANPYHAEWRDALHRVEASHFINAEVTDISNRLHCATHLI
jgi:hypothetical protein